MRKWLNKYVITTAVFAVVMLFIGEQSIAHRLRQRITIRQIEEQRDDYRAKITQQRAEIQMLQHTDSLERFAREQYLMHADNEDVYLIGEN